MGQCTIDSDRNPNVFNLEHDSNGMWLNANYANPDNQWNPDNLWIFRRNSLHFSLAYMAGEFCFEICPFHPPSIFPTSSN